MNVENNSHITIRLIFFYLKVIVYLKARYLHNYSIDISLNNNKIKVKNNTLRY